MMAHLLDSPVLDVFGQMALDEALARACPEVVMLRFFRWRGRGVTFGYAQRAADVERGLPTDIGDAWTRRPTGGGVVVHRSDLTVSCLFPAQGELRPGVFYERLHTAILNGLRGMGLDANLCASGVRSSPQGPGGASHCFVQPVALDVLAHGNKILGGAIRRFGQTVLYQGSLQLPDCRRRAPDYEKAVCDGLASGWGLDWRRGAPSATVLAEATALEATYRSRAWIYRR